jgi:hypothetical protein
MVSSFVGVLLMLASVEAAEKTPSITMEAPGIIVRTGRNAAIYTFPPAGFDFNRPRGYWPYPYPPLPYAHPAFPATPIYPSYGVPGPYVPLGSPYPPPPVEVRAMELKPGGRLVIEVKPDDAAVYVDGMQLTAKTDHGYDIGLLAGRHRIDVRRKEMKPWSQDVEVPAGGGLLVTIQLESLPSEEELKKRTADKPKSASP